MRKCKAKPHEVRAPFLNRLSLQCYCHQSHREGGFVFSPLKSAWALWLLWQISMAEGRLWDPMVRTGRWFSSDSLPPSLLLEFCLWSPAMLWQSPKQTRGDHNGNRNWRPGSNIRVSPRRLQKFPVPHLPVFHQRPETCGVRKCPNDAPCKFLTHKTGRDNIGYSCFKPLSFEQFVT